MSQGQRSRSNMWLCKNNDLSYESQTNDRIMVKLMQRVDIDATLKVTQGQGHKVKGQGRICNYVKICVG